MKWYPEPPKAQVYAHRIIGQGYPEKRVRVLQNEGLWSRAWRGATRLWNPFWIYFLAGREGERSPRKVNSAAHSSLLSKRVLTEVKVHRWGVSSVDESRRISSNSPHFEDPEFTEKIVGCLISDSHDRETVLLEDSWSIYTRFPPKDRARKRADFGTFRRRLSVKDKV